jgi:RecA/RadA recombinase
LIVIDSIAFHFRAVTPTDSQYYIQRTKTLTQLAAYLGDLASHYNLAVVAINQMTTKFIPQQGGKTNNGTFLSTHVPALGESWAHSTTTRVLLKNDEFFVSTTPQEEDDNDISRKPGLGQPQVRQERSCVLVKSPNRPPGSAIFQITQDGIRDVSRKDKAGTASQELDPNCSQKRRRTM